MRAKLVAQPKYSVIRKAACSCELEIEKERTGVYAKEK